MGGLVSKVFGGGSSSSSTTTNTTSKTVLENDTTINSDVDVVFDFKELAEVYREQMELARDGEYTDQEKI